tara:strand:- start:228 stop:434 length:207 start_codon:yes stop_codon:yes gene_type:complete
MKFLKWNTPVKADWSRANELDKLVYDNQSLLLVLTQEDEEKWEITFDSVQEFRVISQECSSDILNLIS